MTRPVLWIYQPEAVRAIGKLGESLVLYDCVDEHAGSPYYQRTPRNLAALLRDEGDLLRRSHIVITTSQPLYASKKGFNPNTHLVHNVADTAHFGQALNDATIVPHEIASLPKPILGFVGALSQYKVDFELLEKLATRHRQWQIVLIGPVGEGDRHTSLAQLTSIPNVHVLGHRSYESLPAYIKGFDVCLIPYRINQYTTGVFPMKFFEFLAAGKPVVSTALPSLREYTNVAYLARTHEEFLNSVGKALTEKDPRRTEQRVDLAHDNSWDSRIDQILHLMSIKQSGMPR